MKDILLWLQQFGQFSLMMLALACLGGWIGIILGKNWVERGAGGVTAVFGGLCIIAAMTY